MLITQPTEDPLGRVALLARGRQIRAQPTVDDLAVVVDLAATIGVVLALARPGRTQSFVHRRPRNPVLTLNRPRRLPGAGIPADRRIQLHLRPRRPHNAIQPAPRGQPVTPESAVTDLTVTTPTPKSVIKRLPNQQSKSLDGTFPLKAQSLVDAIRIRGGIRMNGPLVQNLSSSINANHAQRYNSHTWFGSSSASRIFPRSPRSASDDDFESLWVSRRLGLLDSDQGLVGPLCIVERGFELGGWDVTKVAV